MIRLKPPTEGFKFNGDDVPPEGIEVDDITAESLIKRGWVAAEEEGED